MRFLAFDTETVRLTSGTRAPEMCQIGMISDEIHRHDPADRVLDRRELTLHLDPDIPAEKWDEEAIKVHGITPEDVAGCGTFYEIFPRIVDVAIGAQVLVGYNLKFDVAVLAATLRRECLEHHFPWPMTHVDVMELAQDRLRLQGKRGQKNPTLGEIYEHLFERPLEGAHDALSDIQATIEVWEALRA